MDEKLKQDLLTFIDEVMEVQEVQGKFNEAFAAPHGDEEVDKVRGVTANALKNLEELRERVEDA